MAIEIKELVIRAVVDYPSSSGDKKSQSSPVEKVDGDEEDRSAIVDACVKQVLKILERKQKR